MADPGSDPRLPALVERCYAAICDGEEPDVDAICADAPELTERVRRLLERERQLLLACGEVAAPMPRWNRRMPERIGEFTLIEPIGVGGMSDVFRARQEPLGREVAVKVLRGERDASATARMRFMREASITSSLEHPRIVPVYAAGEHEGRVYLAMKLLRGRSLDRQHTPMPPRQVAQIGCEVASALAAAHEIGVVHRDVKPANIVLEHGHAYVLDFGLAAFADRASVLTHSNATPGTLLYLAPEVAARNSPGLDPRADVYGLGATLYEVLAGRAPFDTDNPVRTLQQILHEPPPPLHLRGRDRDLETIVMRALEKSPQRRFQTAEALRAELQRFVDGEPIETRPTGMLRRFARRCAARPLVSTLTALVLVLGTALVTRVVLQQRADRLELEQRAATLRSAIDAGELAGLDPRLDALASLPDGEPLRQELQRRRDAEHDLQLCVLALGDPLAAGMSGLREAIVERAVARHPVGTRSLRARAVLASIDPAPSRPGEQLAAHFPRTAALLHGPRDEASVAERHRALGSDASAEVLDHVLAAALMRRAAMPETRIEVELRLAPAARRTPLLQHSLSISLEAQGRYREAYETALQLVSDPVVGALANWATARLAAVLDEPRQAAMHRTAAAALRGRDALLDDIVYPSELQVLAEADVGAFWQRWRTAPERCRELPQHWRLAGYVQAQTATGVEELRRARSHLETGLQCGPDRRQRAILLAATCQVDWALLASEIEESEATTLPALTSPLPPPELRSRLEALAATAVALADEIDRDGLRDSLAADALLVAAQCHLEMADWNSASSCFDRAATSDSPAPLAVYAEAVAHFLALRVFDGPDARTLPMPELRRASTVAVERALRVTTSPGGAHPADLATAEAALAACAAFAGQLDTAVTAALRFDGADRCDALLADLAEQVRISGALLFADDLTDDQLLHGLERAAAAFTRERDTGRIVGDAGRQILRAWRTHPARSRLEPLPAWPRLRNTIESLDPTR